MLLRFDEDAQSEMQAQIFDQMRDLGYESHNLIQNLNSLAIFALIYFLKVIFLVMVKAFSALSRNKWGSGDLYERMKANLFFSEIIAIMLEGYLEFLIACSLNLQAPLYSMSGEVFSTILGFLLGFIAFLALPGVLIWLQTKNLEHRSKDFDRKWSGFYEGLRPSSKSSLAFNLMYIGRRVVYIALCFILYKASVLQIFALMQINLFMMVYVGT